MQTIPTFKPNPITLDINTEKLNSSINNDDKGGDPYQFGALASSKGFRVKSAFIGRRNLKSQGSTRAGTKTRNTIMAKSTSQMPSLTADYKGMSVKQVSELLKNAHDTDGWSI